MSDVQFKPEPPMEEKYSEGWKCYCSTFASMKMHRKDAGEIIFINSYYETNNENDQEYLDTEIDKHHNPQVRHATEEEIQFNRMRINPRKTIIDDMIANDQIDGELEAAMEAKFKAKYGIQDNDGTLKQSEEVRPGEGQNILADGTVVDRPLTAFEIFELRKKNEGFKPVSTKDIGAGAAGSASI